jgi:hypothetical protein
MVNDENSRIRIHSQRHGSANPDPDPHQNVRDPEHCFKVIQVVVVNYTNISLEKLMLYSPATVLPSIHKIFQLLTWLSFRVGSGSGPESVSASKYSESRIRIGILTFPTHNTG